MTRLTTGEQIRRADAVARNLGLRSVDVLELVAYVTGDVHTLPAVQR